MKAIRFLLGFGVGIGLGVLFAPVRGEATRHELAHKARHLVEIPKRHLRESLEQAANAAEEKAGDIGSRIGRQAAEAAVESVKKEILGEDKSA